MEPLDGLENLIRRDGKRGHPRHEGTNRLHHLPLHREDALDVPAHDLGQRQEPQRLGGGSAIDDETVVVAALDVGLHIDQGEDLVETRDHGELFGLDRLGASPVHQLDHVVLDLAPVVLEPLLRVDLLAPQVLDDRGRRIPIRVSKESASEWAGSVDITSVRWPALAARTAVAAATVVLPTPPFP